MSSPKVFALAWAFFPVGSHPNWVERLDRSALKFFKKKTIPEVNSDVSSFQDRRGILKGIPQLKHHISQYYISFLLTGPSLTILAEQMRRRR